MIKQQYDVAEISFFCKEQITFFLQMKNRFSVGAVVVREDALRQFHGYDNAQDDGDGHLARHPATVNRQVELRVGQVKIPFSATIITRKKLLNPQPLGIVGHTAPQPLHQQPFIFFIVLKK